MWNCIYVVLNFTNMYGRILPARRLTISHEESIKWYCIVSFNVHTDVNACHCTWGCGHQKGVHWKLTLGRKVPCCTGESNLRQQRASLMLCQLSYISTCIGEEEKKGERKKENMCVDCCVLAICCESNCCKEILFFSQKLFFSTCVC